MQKYNKTIRKKGIIIIYVFIIGVIAMFLSLSVYKMEMLKKDNINKYYYYRISDSKYNFEREALFYELRVNLKKELVKISMEGVKNYCNSKNVIYLKDCNVLWRNSYLVKDVKLCNGAFFKYYADRDKFELCFYDENRFVKKEIYSYKINDENIDFILEQCSFKEGE